MLTDIIDDALEVTNQTSVNKDILVVSDLDFTQFNTYEHEPTWIGGKGHWCDLYTRANNRINHHGGKMVFAIVTRKPDIDNISLEAAKTLRPFLEKHNPHMFITMNDDQWCLIKIKDKHIYLNITTGTNCTNLNTSKDVVSHFEFIPEGNKAEAIKRIALYHGIPLTNVIEHDDDRGVLNEAKDLGIRTVSFECFNYNINALGDQNLVQNNLKRAEAELHGHIDNILGLTKAEIDTEAVYSDLEISDPIPNQSNLGCCGLSALIKTGLACFGLNGQSQNANMSKPDIVNKNEYLRL